MKPEPVQALVMGFTGDAAKAGIAAELEELRRHGAIRIVDLLFLTKSEDGVIDVVESPDRESAIGPLRMSGGNTVAGTGVFDPAVFAKTSRESTTSFNASDIWYLARAMPRGTSAAAVLIEHRWATRLNEVIARAGGVVRANEWIRPIDLVAAGIGPGDPGS